MLYETKNLDMKYEINGFDNVFENKNLMQLKQVLRFLRKANLENSGLYGLVGGGKIFYIAS